MRILNMILENFQGIKNFTFSPDGKTASLFGDNGTGKTTVYNAFCWLLYGKPSTDEKNYSPQTMGTHDLNHIAEAKLQLDDGREITLRKDYHEVYKTKRGSADKTFAGFTTDYFLDGVPVKEKEYQKKLDDLLSFENAAQLLTRPAYFLEEMNIAERRKILLSICGDIDDADILTDPNLSPLVELLEGHTVEEYLKIAAAQKRDIDAELKAIPSRIDEAERSKPEVTESKDALEAAVSLADAERSELEKKKAALSVGGEADLMRQISEIKKERTLAEADFIRAHMDSIRMAQVEVAGMEQWLNVNKNKYDSLDHERALCLSRMEAMEKERESLLKKWAEVNAEKWNDSEVCPTCGQTLPENMIEEKKAKFNLAKSNRLEEITKQGQEVSEYKIAEKSKQAEELAGQMEKLMEEIKEKQAAMEKKKAGIAPTPTFDDSDYKKRIDELESRIEAMKTDTSGEEAKLDEEIRQAISAAAGARDGLSRIEQVKKQDDRIKELKGREKELGSAYEEIENKIYLCEQYSRKRAELLDSKVNTKFKTLRFRLFREQINGGLADDCEALIPCDGAMVPYKSANNAARINAGLEVIDVLGAHFGLTLPVFTDNAESCTTLIPTTAQQIRLYVSEKDKVLRAEYGQ